MKRLAVLLPLVLLALSACSVLPKREPTTIYEPSQSAAANSADWPTASWSLLIAKPTANDMLDSDGIAVRPTAGSFQIYKGAVWPESAPKMVQTTLLRKFEDSQKILSVARTGTIVRGEYELLTELRAFESVYEQPGQPNAVVDIYVRLVHTTDGAVVAARNFKDSELAASENVSDVVAAFASSLGRVSDQIAAWTLSNGNKHQQE
jgi:cholesterol transport system auxiliary component